MKFQKRRTEKEKPLGRMIKTECLKEGRKWHSMDCPDLGQESVLTTAEAVGKPRSTRGGRGL